MPANKAGPVKQGPEHGQTTGPADQKREEKKMIKKAKGKLLKAGIRTRNALDSLAADLSGMGTIEVVLIVAVLVALALIFKTFITRYANTIFTTIDEKTNEALRDW